MFPQSLELQEKMTSLQKKIYLFKAAADEELEPTSSSRKTLLIHNHEENKTTQDNTTSHVKTETGDRFATLLNTLEDVESELVPVLVFEYSNLEEFWRHIKSPGEHSGLIFTSQRCVQSVKEAMINVPEGEKSWQDALKGEWQSKYMFSVGPSTTSKVERLFSTLPTSQTSKLKIIQGEEAHAESLADKIIEVASKESLELPLIYPCGSLRRDVLQKKLNDANVKCLQFVVYQTIENPQLGEMIQRVTGELKDHLSFLCFFSPSGVKFVFQHLDPIAIQSHQVNFVAIGPTTKTALEDALSGIAVQRPVYTCANPTPEALVEIIKFQE